MWQPPRECSHHHCWSRTQTFLKVNGFCSDVKIAPALCHWHARDVSSVASRLSNAHLVIDYQMMAIHPDYSTPTARAIPAPPTVVSSEVEH
jgi:hypothetical protein